MARRASIAALLALLAASEARAQFQPFAMKLPGWPRAELVPGHWTDPAGVATGSDLLVVQASGATVGSMASHQVLLPPFLPDPYAAPAAVRAGTLGSFDGSPDANSRVPDAVWAEAAGISVAWGTSPGAIDPFPSLFAYYADGMGSARLLPGRPPLALVVGGVHDFQTPVDLPGLLYAVDLSASKGPPAAAPPTRTWDIPPYDAARDGDSLDRAFPLQLSPTARANGIDDVLVPFGRGFLLLWHDAVAAAPDINLVGASPLAFGVTSGGDLAPYLRGPYDTTFNCGSCLGGAAHDVDGDGVPDLVLSYADHYWPSKPGALFWIRNTGDPVEMVGQRWGSLMGRVDLPITDAWTLRHLDLGEGEPAFAVFDRTRGEILVVRGNRVTGFDVTTLPAPGGIVRDMIAADVVGSSAKDLVVLVDLAPGYTTSEVWVYPDDDDMATTLAFSPGLPVSAPLGVDLTLTVAMSDPDVPATEMASISWLRPVLPETVAQLGSSWTVNGLDLCSVTSWDFEVRALDSLGVYTALSGSVPVEGRPAAWLAGEAAAGPLVLAPGGVSGRAEGEAWPACATGAPTYSWGQSLLSGLVETHQPDLSATAWIDFTLPEAAYAEALSGLPALTLAATGPTAAGTVTGSTTLPVSIDARGLVAVAVAFDQGSLAPGELGLARARLTSRVGVPLPGVRAVIRLAGLAFAGSTVVVGATATVGPEAGEVVFDPLPAAPATVELMVPVRSIGRPGALSVELFSAGNHRVSPEASPTPGGAPVAGCGCGDRGAGPLGLLLLIALAVRGRRRPT